MDEQRFGRAEKIVVHTEDGGSTGHVAAVYLTPDGPAPLARVVWDDDQLESLVPVPASMFEVGQLRLDVTTADRDAAELIADDRVAQFVRESLTPSRADVLGPIKKIRPTAPNPPFAGDDDRRLPPIKVITTGVAAPHVNG